MHFLRRHAKKKFTPRELLPGCNTLIFTGLNYYQPREELAPGHGAVARFAWGRDYHKVLGKRLRRISLALRELFPGEGFYTFVDSSPLAERQFAERAGVGFIGRNTLLIRRGLGSWFVIGGIATTLEADRLKFDATRVFGAKNEKPAGFGCPPGCRRCIEACPTGALFAPYRIDARKCISYLTIEHRGSLDEGQAQSIGGWIFGCDACQEACPFNRTVEKTYVADFLSARAGQSLSIKDILTMATASSFSKEFAGSPLMRAKRSGLVRNACVCAANLGLRDRLPQIEKLISDSDEVIARQARRAVKTLRAK